MNPWFNFDAPSVVPTADLIMKRQNKESNE
jgi:hypothetical protein